MNPKSGKTLTIFIILITVLLVSSTAIGFFMYQKESQMRHDMEVQLSDNIKAQKKLFDDLKDSKSQLALLQDKNKEADKKINSLMDEMELTEGLKNELKKENGSLKEALETAKKEKDAVRADLDTAAKKLLESQTLLKEEQEKTKTLLAKIKDTPEVSSDLNVADSSKQTMVREIISESKNKMELGKIVVGEDNSGRGKVVSVDKESDFVICNLGINQGVKTGDILAIYRGDRYLGDVKVSRAQDEMSAADFIAPLSSRKVRKNDIIVLKQS